MNDKTFLFARRTQWETGANALTNTLKELRLSKVEILDLTESNPTRCGFDYPENKILQPLIQKNNLVYAPDPQGMVAAREAISRDYQAKGYAVSPDQIFLTSSTSEGYAHLFRLLANPHERILFPKPSYPLFEFLVDLNDVVMDHYALTYDRHWSIDFDSLKRALTPETKAVALVNPNNPTGSYAGHAEIEKINDICLKNHLAIICDEVFFDFCFDETTERESFVTNAPVLTFSLGGLSKTLGLPQMKLSWIAVSGPKGAAALARERLEIICDTYLSVNTPVSNAAPQWFSYREDIQGQIQKRIQQNLDFLQRQTAPKSFARLLNTQGGWYAILKIPDTINEEQRCLNFLTQDHVLVHPGYFFNFDHEAYLVISLLPQEDVFREGIGRILKRVEKSD